MAPKDLAQVLKDYRSRHGLSQGDLARRLDFTQATVSRIEAGKQVPREKQIRKILDLILPDSNSLVLGLAQKNATEEKAPIPFLEDYLTFARLEWNCFRASRPYDSAGGDVLLISELKRNSRVGILVGDSVGHGKSSSYMSFALEFAYDAIASVFNPQLLSPELFDRAMATAIVKTAKDWRGEPSMIILQLDLETSQVAFVNRGMPYPILLEGEKSTLITEKRAGAFSLQQIFSANLSFNQPLTPGQSIFLYSDGLLDLLPEDTLLPTMQKLNKVFKGDSRAIGRNLIRHIEKNQNKTISDDVSFLVISRAMKRKK